MNDEHEAKAKTSAGAQKWVTILIIGLCVVMFFIARASQKEKQGRMATCMLDYINYHRTYGEDLIKDPELEGYINDQDFALSFIRSGFLMTQELALKQMQSRTGGSDDDEEYEDAKEEANKRITEIFGSMIAQAQREGGNTDVDFPVGYEPEEVDPEEAQAELNRRGEAFKDALDAVPYIRWGVVPVRNNILSLVTYPFFHTSLLSLLCYLLILFYLGSLLEERLGPLFYSVFLFLSVLVGGLAYLLFNRGNSNPLHGLELVVVGILVACVFRYPRRSTWIVLGFFIGFQVVWNWFKSFSPFDMGFADMLVPYIAIGVVSMGMMAGFRHFGIERGEDAEEEGKVREIINGGGRPRGGGNAEKLYDKAMEMQTMDKHDEAYELMRQAVTAGGSEIHMVEAFWNMSIQRDNGREGATYLRHLIEREVRRNEMDAAWYHLQQLNQVFPGSTLSGPSHLAMVKFLLFQDDKDSAREMARLMVQTFDHSTPPGLVLEFEDLVYKLGPEIAEQVEAFVQRHPEIPEEKKAAFKEQLERARADERVMDENKSNTQESGASYDGETTIPIDTGSTGTTYDLEANMPPQSAPPPATNGAASPVSQSGVTLDLDNLDGIEQPGKQFQVVHAEPLELKQDQMIIDIEGKGKRTFELKTVRAISFVKIVSQGDKPFILLDLFLDDPQSMSATIRTVRIKSPTFNPVRLYPDAGSLGPAFRTFTDWLMQHSGARPVPSIDSVTLKKISLFPTIDEYQKEIG